MRRSVRGLFASAALVITAPAFAQDHSAHGKPAATEPAQQPAPAMGEPAATAQSAKPKQPAEQSEPMDHSGMDHSSMPEMEAVEPATGTGEGESQMQMTGTALPAGDAPAPPVPGSFYADRQFPSAEMAGVRHQSMREHGSTTTGTVQLNIFEYQAHSGRDGYRWDGEAWYGGDIDRLWIKSEGEGEFGGRLDSGEIQALYSRAIAPYFNLQAGIRQDFGPAPRRTYAVLAIEGLAPGMFETEGSVFLSNKGELLVRLEGYYEQRITQRLVLQPRVEFNLAAQDIPENDIGAGPVNLEVGLRLRYEISRQFAPYVGVSYYRKFGETARLSRIAGEDVHATSFVAGVRFWF